MNSGRKPLIGLTGGIGTGKSTVARLLEQRGAVVIDADKLGHEVLQPGGAAFEATVEAFGTDILDDQGRIDRAKLGAKVFGDPAARKTLEGITHPAIGLALAERIQDAMARGPEVPAVVLEIVLLIENNRQDMVDEVWVTLADEQTVIDRVKDRSGLTPEEIHARRAAQVSDDKRREVATVVFENTGTLADLEAAVDREWKRITGSG